MWAALWLCRNLHCVTVRLWVATFWGICMAPRRNYTEFFFSYMNSVMAEVNVLAAIVCSGYISFVCTQLCIVFASWLMFCCCAFGFVLWWSLLTCLFIQTRSHNIVTHWYISCWCQAQTHASHRCFQQNATRYSGEHANLHRPLHRPRL
jgi:hypothetical protein